jgi:4-hydroxybenzoate polyprenyltransferase
VESGPPGRIAARVSELAVDYSPPSFAHVPDPDAALFLCAVDHRTGYRGRYLVSGRGPFEGSALLWAVGPAAFASGLVLIALIAIYDRWHKNNPLSPLVMAGCRLMVYVTAFVAFTWPPSPALVVAGGLLVAYLVGLTAIAKSETRPTVVGYWPAALLFLPPLYFATRLGVGPALVLPLLVAVWVVYCLTFVYRARTRSIGAAIGRLIAGISLIDGLVLASSGALDSLWLAVAGFGLTLFFQRYIEGT